MGARRVIEALVRRDQGETTPLPLEPLYPRKGRGGCALQRQDDLAWTIDPDFLGDRRRRGPAAHEPFRVGEIRAIERALADMREFQMTPGIHVGRREEADAFVAVLVVVPVEERAAPGLGVVVAGELAGELRAVLERLELRL